MGHDDGVDPVGHRVACEDENRSITASPDVGEPDLLASLAEHLGPVGVIVRPGLVRPDRGLGRGERLRCVTLGIALTSTAVEELAHRTIEKIAPRDARFDRSGIELFGECSVGASSGSLSYVQYTNCRREDGASRLAAGLSPSRGAGNEHAFEQ
ncbi:MAG: hypothetical protein R2755_27925 [Acidimicrobiales bacterium]